MHDLSFQLRADSVQDLSMLDQFSPKSHSFPGELIQLRSLSEVSETMATIAKAACQCKRHSFSFGGCPAASIHMLVTHPCTTSVHSNFFFFLHYFDLAPVLMVTTLNVCHHLYAVSSFSRWSNALA